MKTILSLQFSAIVLQINLCTGLVQLNGAGASFPYDVYSAWLPAYKASRAQFLEISMKYESSGSGDGKSRIKGLTGPPVAYAGSDSVLNASEYQQFPDLQMFPSIAGAIVMAFNIPGITELNLKMSDVVGIYNGSIRYWNHSSLASSNPGKKFPGEKIHVAARRDSSGTTEIFTAALSAYDVRWKNTYGTFTAGLNADDTPAKWNPDVVTLYGETNRGVSGMLLSTKYSIGYLVLSDVIAAKLPYAVLKNQAGNFIRPTVTSVQSAMDDFSDKFNKYMTASLANPPGAHSYPISGYTYIIVRMQSLRDCIVAKELVRYVEWFYTDTVAQTECENLYMVPLSKTVYTMVTDNVLKHITCNGDNVYNMVLADKENERISLQTWRLPVFVSTPIIGVFFIVLILYLVRDQLKIHRELLKNEWRIPQGEITFTDEIPSQSLSFFSGSSGSKNKVHPCKSNSEIQDAASTFQQLHEVGHKVGRFKGHRVVLLEQSLLSKNVNLRMKRGILWMRNQVGHTNISQFYGLYSAEDVFYTVSAFYSRGDLQNFLQLSKYNMDSNFKYALCMGVAKGMAYLHSQNLIHGSLTSTKVYIDDHWTVRVAGWESHQLARYQGKSLIIPDMEVTEWASEAFWNAPEILNGRSLPTMASDVYSFSIVMQEVFSRDIPYAEQSDFHTPKEVLDGIVTASQRPLFSPETPLEAREIMQHSWDIDPVGRPSFENIVKLIRKACPKIRSVMDCALESLSQYVTQLEENTESTRRMLTEKVNCADSEDNTQVTSTKMLALSPQILKVLGSKEPTPQIYDSVSILVSYVHGLESLIKISTPREITEMLDDLHQTLEGMLGNRQDVILVDVMNDRYTLVSGLSHGNSDHLKVIADFALSLLHMARTFTIRHRHDDSLKLKIGLGTGSVVTGLVGLKSCRYVVIGEALTRAQNMAATSLPMGIHMCEETYILITILKNFTCIERKDSNNRQQESKGTFPRTYWLISSKDLPIAFTPENM